MIPTYNSAEFLKRALKSVFAQNFQDFEIIVVDNSSTDKTKEVIKSYDDGRLKFISVNNDGIIAHSRNVGINNSKGQWIAFLDSDDIWQQDKLEKSWLAIHQKPDVILVCHDEWHVHNGEIKKRLEYGPTCPDMYERLLFTGNCISTSAVCLRKDIALESKGFSERKDFITTEDYEYWIRLALIGGFYFINDILGEWHTHSSNYSSNAEIHAFALLAVLNHHLDLMLKKHPNKSRQIKSARSKAQMDAGRIFQKNGSFTKAIKFELHAIRLYPFRWKAWVIIILSLLRIKSNKL